MDAHNVSTDQSFETEAHSKKGARDDKVSGASEETQTEKKASVRLNLRVRLKQRMIPYRSGREV